MRAGRGRGRGLRARRRRGLPRRRAAGAASTPGPIGQRSRGRVPARALRRRAHRRAKLLHLTRPDVAFFGQKDAQQLALIRRMVTDLNFPVEIVGGADRARRRRAGAVQPQPLPVRADRRGGARAVRGRCGPGRPRRAAEPSGAAGAPGPCSRRARAGAWTTWRWSTRALRGRPDDADRPGAAGGGRPGRHHPADRQRGSCASGGSRWRCCSPSTSGTPTPCSALFDGDRVVEHWRIATVPDRTADEIAVVLHGLLAGAARSRKGTSALYRCARPCRRCYARCERCVQRYYGDLETVIVEPGVKTGVPVRTDNPKEVGSDRIINSLAAVHLYGGPCHRRGFRDFDELRRGVSARGEFVGGALAPGIEISVEALSRRAAQLLKVELTGRPASSARIRSSRCNRASSTASPPGRGNCDSGWHGNFRAG